MVIIVMIVIKIMGGNKSEYTLSGICVSVILVMRNQITKFKNRNRDTTRQSKDKKIEHKVS